MFLLWRMNCTRHRVLQQFQEDFLHSAGTKKHNSLFSFILASKSRRAVHICNCDWVVMMHLVYIDYMWYIYMLYMYLLYVIYIYSAYVYIYMYIWKLGIGLLDIIQKISLCSEIVFWSFSTFLLCLFFL